MSTLALLRLLGKLQVGHTAVLSGPALHAGIAAGGPHLSAAGLHASTTTAAFGAASFAMVAVMIMVVVAMFAALRVLRAIVAEAIKVLVGIGRMLFTFVAASFFTVVVFVMLMRSGR